MNELKIIAVFFSHIKEANPFLFHSGIKFIKISKTKFEGKYTNLIIKVFITGIGKKTFAFLNNNSFEKYNYFIKAGTCAVIEKKIPLLKIFIPKYVSFNGQKIKITHGQSIKRLLINKKLLTMEKPLFDKNQAYDLSKDFSFVDMETFYIIDKFKSQNVFPLLIGTDRGDKAGMLDFLKNLKKAGEILKDQLLELLPLL